MVFLDFFFEILKSRQIALPKLLLECKYFFDLVRIHLVKLTEVETSVRLVAAVSMFFRALIDVFLQ